MSKQDRQGARTPADLERKYEFGQALSEMEEASKKQSDQIARQNNTMNEFIGKSSGEIASLEKDVSRAKKDISNLKLNVTSFSVRLSNIEQGDKATSQSITGLAQRISSLEKDLSSFKTSVNTRLETAESTLTDLVGRVTALESTTESGG